MPCLVLNSILFAGLTSIFAAILGMIAFMALISFPLRLHKVAIVGAIACFLMPPFLHAGAWWDIGMKLSLPIATLPFGAMVLSLQLWPIITLLLFASSTRLDSSLLEAAKLSLSNRRTWGHVIFPLLSPALALACLVVFILTLNNFIVPTTFQTYVQIAEIYVMFSSLYDTCAALLQSVPLWIISLFILSTAAGLTRRITTGWANRHVARRLDLSMFPQLCNRPLCLLIFALLLMISLLPSSWRLISSVSSVDMLTTWRLAIPQFVASFIYAAGSALLSCFIGLILGRTALCRQCVPAEWILITPFILSGLFLSILLIALNQWAGAWAWWQGTWLLGVAALTIRFVWIPFKTATATLSQIHPDLLDAARLFAIPSGSIFRHIQWPLLKPFMLAAAWIVYLLALWDVETLLLVYPPGGEPVSLKIFQLLHYGYDAQVAVLSLGLLVMGLLPGGFLALYLRNSRKSIPLNTTTIHEI